MKPTQEQIAALVKCLRNSGSRSEIEIHEDREEAADMLERFMALLEVLRSEDDRGYRLSPEAMEALHNVIGETP